jgi:DNA-binding phage protein
MPPLTRPFSDTVHEQLRKSASFRSAYLRGTMECLVAGEIETGKTLLRDYVEGTIGFAKLSAALGRSSASLKRMFTPKANPALRSFFEVTTYLLKRDRTVLKIVDRKAA